MVIQLVFESSERDYKAALKRINSLFDTADPGTTKGDELEILVTLIEEYEKALFIWSDETHFAPILIQIGFV